VIAAGAWSSKVGDMFGVHIPLVPVRGQMWSTPPMPPELFHVVTSAESHAYWHAHPGGDGATPPRLTHDRTTRLTRNLYGRQTRCGELIFGGDRQAVGYQNAPDPSGIAVNRDHAIEVLPFLRELPVTRTWATLMPFSLDGAPLIGRIPEYENLYLITALSPSGFGRGAAAGKLLAEGFIQGHLSPLLAAASPTRCVTVNPNRRARRPPRQVRS
jgi:sarcosine oxidase subunit beta